jgi:hypothetical protein
MILFINLELKESAIKAHNMQKFHIIESTIILGILFSVFFITGVFAQSSDDCSCLTESGNSVYPDPCLCSSDGQGNMNPSLCSCPFSSSKVTLPACCCCVFGPSCSRTTRTRVGSLDVSFSSNVTSGPAPLAVQFSDSSTGSPTGWAWDFGDGGVSAEQNPVHVYTNPGTYTVGLSVTRSYSSVSMSVSEGRGMTKPGFIVVTGVSSVVQESPVAEAAPTKSITSLTESRKDDLATFLSTQRSTRFSGITRFR